jgi:hypothetical protein
MAFGKGMGKGGYWDHGAGKGGDPFYPGYSYGRRSQSTGRKGGKGQRKTVKINTILIFTQKGLRGAKLFVAKIPSASDVLSWEISLIKLVGIVAGILILDVLQGLVASRLLPAPLLARASSASIIPRWLN